MPYISINIDHCTLQRLNELAPTASRQRAGFIRQAIKEAIRRREYERIRQAYLREPDAATEADDWSSSEHWAR